MRIDDENALYFREVLVLVDSVTHLSFRDAGSVVVSGSHAGVYSAKVLLNYGARAAVLHDAGVGLEGAGIQGLALMEAADVPAVAVGSESALIGSANEVYKRGLISHVNRVAAQLGCAVGQPAREAVDLLARATPSHAYAQTASESRWLIANADGDVWALDSASLVGLRDISPVVITGSHGELLGGDRASALKARARAAVFNDAGRPAWPPAGRLCALGLEGVPAATVAGLSARIGDGRSSYYDGVISQVNEPASELGATVGMTCVEFVELLAPVNDRTAVPLGKETDVH